ncbi:MAG: hypothetical protein AAGA66_18135, partial [Bacteroidota bacterium]
MNRYFEKYLELLWNQFEYDMDVLSQPWMYYWLLIPAIAYLIFFFTKWVVLTTPLWMPVSVVFQSFR